MSVPTWGKFSILPQAWLKMTTHCDTSGSHRQRISSGGQISGFKYQVNCIVSSDPVCVIALTACCRGRARLLSDIVISLDKRVRASRQTGSREDAREQIAQ